METKGGARTAAGAGAAIVIAVVRCKRIGGNSGGVSCMQKCRDNNSGRSHCYYCHSLQLRGLLLS
jgi:hypothetical protein